MTSREPGTYQITEVREGGPFGAVCVVRHPSLARPVMMKVLRTSLLQNPTFLTRIRDEARLLGRLNHPHIIRVEGLLSIKRRPVVVMEALEGVSSRQLLQASGDGLALPVCLELIRRATRAVHDAYHGFAGPSGGPLRLVHRDIRPRNLFVSVHGEVKLLDFGLSRASLPDRETSTVSTILGPGSYPAPEQYAGARASPSLDVYALGMTLMELLTGRNPSVPPDPDLHGPALAAALDQVKLPRHDALGNTQDRVLRLIHDMCAFHPDERLDTEQVIDRVRELQVSLDVLPDLVAFASEEVVPRVADALRQPPSQQPDWAEVRFLETATGPDPDDPQEATAVADQHVRAFMARGGWEKRYPELKEVLARHDQWSTRPFLEVLERSASPWWRFWSRPTPQQVEVSLRALRRKATQDVVAQARQFLDHTEPRVAQAALRLVQRHLEGH